jgi:hypothetical protein
MRVRELAARYGTSQDSLVDTAIERLDRELSEQDEAERWAAAAADADFAVESRDIAAAFDDRDRWPA